MHTIALLYKYEGIVIKNEQEAIFKKQIRDDVNEPTTMEPLDHVVDVDELELTSTKYITTFLLSKKVT
jgi:hypothetical protein